MAPARSGNRRASELRDTASTPRVTFLVPNYNGRELLDVLLPSIAAQTYTDYEVLLVDDASTDDSVAYTESKWPSAKVLRRAVNAGFAATVNTGINAARSELVAILNTDVELDPGWLQALVDTLDRHREAGSASGKTLLYAERRLLDGAGNLMYWSGAATRRGYRTPDVGQFDQPGEVISACAGYALYRRSAFDLIGDFDEDLVAYYEDVDWGLRAQLAGLSCRYEPAALAFHIGGASHGTTPRFLRLLRRNQLLVVIKDYPARALLRHLPEIVIGQLLHFANALADRDVAAVRLQLLAMLDACRAAPTMWRKRAGSGARQPDAEQLLDRVMTQHGRSRLGRAR
ncbi:MAG: glycosyltransferase family 2 protein [Solirubrobacteraceae bacterium]